MTFKKGDTVIYEGKEVQIGEIYKGAKTNKSNLQSGILFTGFKSKPKTYLLTNGLRVRGNKIKSINQS